MSEILVAEDQVIGVVVDGEQVLTVESRAESVVAVLSGPEQIIAVLANGTERMAVIESECTAIVQVAVTESGPQGRPGTDSIDLPLVAAAAIGGQRVIATDEQGKAVYADNLTRYKTVIGISTRAAVQGAVVTVKPFGRLEDTSWNWNPEKGLFLGINGLIVQDVPDTGVIVPLGHVAGADAIFITISDFIER
jgi:hypothetical protein